MDCKKCNNQGSIITEYKDGHQDIDLCDCEYNPYKQLKALKEENKLLREQQVGLNTIREIAHDYKDKCEKYEKALKNVLKEFENEFGCLNTLNGIGYECGECSITLNCSYYIAKKALGE